MSNYVALRRLVGAAVGVVILTTLAFVGTGCQLAPASAAVPWKGLHKIGLVLPFTGHDSEAATNVLAAVKLALGEINAQGGVAGHRIELVALDDEGSPEVAAQQARELAADPMVIGALGHLASDPALGAAGEYERLALPFLALSAPGLPAKSGPATVLRMSASDEQVAVAMSEACRRMAVASVFVVAAPSEGYRGQAEAVKRALHAAGIGLAGEATVAPHVREFGELVEQVKRSGASLVFYSGDFKQASLLNSALGQGATGIRFMAGSDADTPGFGRLLVGSAGQVMYVTATPARRTEAEAALARAYQEKTGQRALPQAVMAYDAVKLLAQAAASLDKAGQPASRPTLLAELNKGSEYQGVSGPIRFEAGGRVDSWAEVRVVKGSYPGEPLADSVAGWAVAEYDKP